MAFDFQEFQRQRGLDFWHETSPEGLELPDKMPGYLNLCALTTAEGLKLPEHVGVDIHLWSLDPDDYNQEVHGPRELGLYVYFSDPDDDDY